MEVAKKWELVVMMVGGSIAVQCWSNLPNQPKGKFVVSTLSWRAEASQSSAFSCEKDRENNIVAIVVSIRVVHVYNNEYQSKKVVYVCFEKWKQKYNKNKRVDKV